MSTDPMMEPPPWPDDAPTLVPPPDPRGLTRPMTQREMDIWLSMPIETRVYDAFRCMWNLMAEDGIGAGSGTWRQCHTRIADPTRSRYCLEHATTLGVEFFSPGEFSEQAAAEASANLTRLVPKAVKTLEAVMNDPDAPAGIKAKAADSVLDRTGYAKGVDVKIDAEVSVIDITSVIQDRLNALRDAALGTPSDPAAITTEIIEAEIVSDDSDDSADSSSDSPVAETPPTAGTLAPDEHEHAGDAPTSAAPAD